MPKRRTLIKRRMPMRKMRGRGKTWNKIKSWLSGANKYLKKNKILSKGAKFYSDNASAFGLPYSSEIGKAGGVASSLGYGRRRKMRKSYGGALRPAGNGLTPAGGMRRRRRRR